MVVIPNGFDVEAKWKSVTQTNMPTSVRIIGLVSLTTYVVCVNFIHSGGIHNLKSTPNDRFFEKLFIAILIYFQSFCQKSAERKSPKKYFLYFHLMSGLGLEPWLYHPLDYDDFVPNIE